MGILGSSFRGVYGFQGFRVSGFRGLHRVFYKTRSFPETKGPKTLTLRVRNTTRTTQRPLALRSWFRRRIVSTRVLGERRLLCNCTAVVPDVRVQGRIKDTLTLHCMRHRHQVSSLDKLHVGRTRTLNLT